MAVVAIPVRADSSGGIDPISVLVGYADGLRGVGFFPTPWSGDPNTVFIGGGTVDAGAIRIDNTGASSITIDSVSVLLHGAPTAGCFVGGSCNSPQPANLWGSSIVVPAGSHLILTQTFSFNFDTSDNPLMGGCGPAVANGATPFPQITITIAGTPHVFDDTAHVLDTGGFDFACQGNESLQWRPIGTCGVSCPGGSISVSKFYTDTSLNSLPLDQFGNPKVDVILAGGVVRSTNPGEIIAWVNVTDSGGVSVDSVKLNETLPS